jgi:hypothetical protein
MALTSLIALTVCTSTRTFFSGGIFKNITRADADWSALSRLPRWYKRRWQAKTLCAPIPAGRFTRWLVLTATPDGRAFLQRLLD